MRLVEYSHRHGKELCQVLRPSLHQEVLATPGELPPSITVPKSTPTSRTPSKMPSRNAAGSARPEPTSEGGKIDYLDLCKWKVAIEMEWSRFEMFFRDFFRFMLLYERKQIDVGIILTYDGMAYRRWEDEANAYKSARASFARLTDFLKGDYSTVVRVPLWCIGVE